MNFVLTGSKALEIWNVEKAGIVKTIECESKPTSVCWLDSNNLLIGLNDGKLIWSTLDSDEVRNILNSSKIRVVQLSFFLFFEAIEV